VAATIDLATLDEVRRSPALEGERTAATPDPDVNEFLTMGIHAFSERAERECGRWFKRATYTETLDIDCGQMLLQLRAYPIVAITSVKEALDGDFATATTVEPKTYALVASGRTGLLRLRHRFFLEGPQNVRVEYTGGLAEETNQLPADLRQACVDQVAFEFRSAPKSHLRSEGQMQGSASYYRDETTLLPAVERVLAGYRVPG
jgi:hypothetical protein